MYLCFMKLLLQQEEEEEEDDSTLNSMFATRCHIRDGNLVAKTKQTIIQKRRNKRDKLQLKRQTER